MKIKNLTNPQFFTSLNKIMRAEIPVSVAWRLKNLGKYLEKNHKSYDEMRRDLLLKHGEKDKSGELVVDQAGMVVFKDETAKETFNKAHLELLDQEIEIDQKVSLKDLSTIKLTASDLLVLEDIIQE